MRPLFLVGPVSSWRERYVQNYVFAFCACGWGLVLFRNFRAGKVCFYVFMFPENEPVDARTAGSLISFPATSFLGTSPTSPTQIDVQGETSACIRPTCYVSEHTDVYDKGE
jgi:hypothetical protein